MKGCPLVTAWNFIDIPSLFIFSNFFQTSLGNIDIEGKKKIIIDASAFNEQHVLVQIIFSVSYIISCRELSDAFRHLGTRFDQR